MPLEDLTGPNVYISSLVESNPPAADDRLQGAPHIRGTKNSLKNSFPLISGPVSSSHTDLSHCAGASSNFQAQIDGIETRVTTNEGNITNNASGVSSNASGVSSNASSIGSLDSRVTALEGGGGSAAFPPARGVSFSSFSSITSSSVYQAIAGATLLVPSGWGSVSIKVDAFINTLLNLSANGGYGLLLADFAIYANETLKYQCVSGSGIEAVTPPNPGLLQLETLVPVSAIIAVSGGQTITIRAKKNGVAHASMGMSINPNAVSSSLMIMPVDLAG